MIQLKDEERSRRMDGHGAGYRKKIVQGNCCVSHDGEGECHVRRPMIFVKL